MKSDDTQREAYLIFEKILLSVGNPPVSISSDMKEFIRLIVEAAIEEMKTQEKQT